MSDLYDFDMNYIKKGIKYLCGIDEAGRGPLAGPVYAAAFIFPNFEIEKVNDSKKLTPNKRKNIFKLINDSNFVYAIGISSAEEIDKINILNATHLAMQRAVENLRVSPDLILVDGNSAPNFGTKCEKIIKGDLKSYSIACASIIAKVLRDQFMLEISSKFPNYRFEKNKGYGTKLHINSIKKYGVCNIHRKSFLGKIL